MLNRLKILIACEESQAVCIQMRERGHEAYSCDTQDCSGGHPEWHIKGDAIDILYRYNWDLVIAHPPCTRLANSGVRWLHERDLWNDLYRDAEFFNQFVRYGLAGHKIAIENPIQHKHAKKLILEPYSQIVQPYHFGHTEKKATCLWLFGLPKLKETNNVYNEMMKLNYKERSKIHYCSPGKDRAKQRSETFPGIAKAMSEQWT